MADRIGSTVFWSIADDIVVDVATVVSLGFDSVKPENMPRARLLKAVDKVKREWDISEGASSATKVARRTIRSRHKDTPDEVRITLFRPVHEAGGTMRYDAAFMVTLTKKDSSLRFSDSTLAPEIFDRLTLRIREEFRVDGTFNAKQFREMVARWVTKPYGCNGISLRPFSGGVYFVKDDFQPQLDKLESLFTAIGAKAWLDAMPTLNDEATLRTVSRHTVTSFQKELETLLKELEVLAKGGATSRVMESKMEEIETLRARIDAFSEHLGESAANFDKMADGYLRVLDERFNAAVEKRVEPFDFGAELARMETPEADTGPTGTV